MNMKTNIFKWAMKRQLDRIKVDDIIITSEAIEIELNYPKTTIKVPIVLDTPSWFTVIKMALKELLHIE